MSDSIRRIIIIDDNPEIHKDFHSILGKVEVNEELDILESELFGTPPPSHNILTPEYELYYASQGQEGVAIVNRHHQNNIPFHLAFVDMRMPPGWDGLETIERMWKIDSSIQVVICTAYSDYSWANIIERLGNAENLLILKKPFEMAEVTQIARTLTGKWLLAKQASEYNEQLKYFKGAPVTVEESDIDINEKRQPELIADLSKEIRTPMTGIIGMTDLVLQTELSDVQRDYLEVVRTSGESLLGIVNDILDYSKLEDGKMQLNILAFNLRHTIESVMETISIKAYKKGIDLIGEIDDTVPEIVKSDPGKIRQILLTLLSNSIKYSDSGKIEISVSVKKDQSSQTESLIDFSIKDSGPGISKEQMDIIFGEFSSTGLTEDKSLNSTNLGLTISRKLIELCGGKLSIDSVEGQGTVFRFPLPVESMKEDLSDKPLSVTLENKFVVILKDNSDEFNIAICFLEHFKVKQQTVTSEEELYKMLDKKSPDLLIIDVNVSSDHIFKVAGEVRSRYQTPSVLITTSGKTGDASNCIENGIKGYLIKPMLLSTFQKTITRVLSGATRTEELITRHTIDEYERKEWEAYTNNLKVKLNILLVEDDLVNRMLIKSIINKTNHGIDIAESGYESIKLFQQNSYNLILMDISMPGMDGIETTRRIRELEKELNLERTPVIAITAHSFKQNRTAAINAGMDDYISKPIHLSKLLTIIDKHIRNRVHKMSS